MHVTYGSNTSMNSRSRNVGIGSNEHDLDAEAVMMRRTSVSEQGRKNDSDDGAESRTVRAGRPAVADITSSTLRLKNSAKPSAVWPVVPDVSRSRPNIVDNDRQSCGDERPC